MNLNPQPISSDSVLDAANRLLHVADIPEKAKVMVLLIKNPLTGEFTAVDSTLLVKRNVAAGAQLTAAQVAAVKASDNPSATNAFITQTALESAAEVLEYAQLSAFPTTGKAGKIYLALNSNKQYRYSSAGYALLSDSGLTANQLASFPAGVSASAKLAALSDLDVVSRYFNDLLALYAKFIIRWDQESLITIGSTSNPSTTYTSGKAFAITASSSTTIAQRVFSLSAVDYPRKGDLVAARILVGSETINFKGLRFGSANGPNFLVGTGGTQYIFHACASDPNSFIADYWQVHSAGIADGDEFFDLGNVPTQKALDVIAAYQANGGPVEETDEKYFGQEFIDDYTDPGNEWWYVCRLRRVATGTPVRIWKWGRYLEAGI